MESKFESLSSKVIILLAIALGISYNSLPIKLIDSLLL